MANPPLSDDRKKKLAADCFKRGTEAMMKQDWEYSCEMFRQSVNLAPESLLYRQSLRGVTERRYFTRGITPVISKDVREAIYAEIKKSRRDRDWMAVVRICEDGLTLNPWDPSLNAELGTALSALGFIDAAEFAYKKAATEDLPHQLRSLIEHGKRLIAEGLYVLARRPFEFALEVCNPDDNFELFTEIMYFRSRLGDDPPDFESGSPVLA